MNEYKEFKVGDTVWTVRRGKLKIVWEVLGGSKYNRLWACCKHDGSIHDGVWYPKSENLIPTEAKYKAAMTGGFRVDIAFVTPYNPTVDVKFSASPKFKVGDAVFYKGEKWEIHHQMPSGTEWYITQKLHAGWVAQESDLRLWKETKFTHWLVSVNGKIEKSETKMTPRDYVDVTYLGKLFGCTDTFSATNPRTKAIKIFFGEKGDDC